MLMGTREERIIKEPAPEDMPDVFNDMDIDYSGGGSGDPGGGVRTAVNVARLQQRISDVEVTLINSLRPGKKLLVFDLDYTLCGHADRWFISFLLTSFLFLFFCLCLFILCAYVSMGAGLLVGLFLSCLLPSCFYFFCLCLFVLCAYSMSMGAGLLVAPRGGDTISS